jgi:hypothetical protein
VTARRVDMSDLPNWPRGLSGEQAAAYVGVSIPTFLAEVELGIWPGPRRGGLRGGRKIWDRVAIDRCYDRLSGLMGDGSSEDEAIERLA